MNHRSVLEPNMEVFVCSQHLDVPPQSHSSSKQELQRREFEGRMSHCVHPDVRLTSECCLYVRSAQLLMVRLDCEGFGLVELFTVTVGP